MLTKPVINKLNKYFKTQKNILAVYLYGSYANGLPNKMSDIDFGIVLNKTISDSRAFNLRLKYMGVLDTLLRKDLKFQYADAVILNNTSPLLKLQAIYFGKLIYSRDDEQRIKLDVKFLQEYEDTLNLREIQNKYLIERVKEGRFGVKPILKGIK
ncbi:MAG: DNA polymerase beta subunit [uncultured bacterium]|nr:MAG: DNA polymerase beta subunit [uncultured bacterium]